jgi:arylformamidase
LIARGRFDGVEVEVDLSRATSLAIELDFVSGPRHFGAPPPVARPFTAPGFPGAVAQGASCNCNVITLIPHCNGTHTESVGHLTQQRFDTYRVVPSGLLPAVVLSVRPVEASAVNETTHPTPKRGDLLIARSALKAAWPLAVPYHPRAAVIRTLPNEIDKKQRDYSSSTPPYLSLEAAEWLRDRGIEHLVVDLPSIDRAHDEGRLTAHRVFFGLPATSHSLDEAQRPNATITELAFIPDSVGDGPALLEIQVPALAGDAVPSRPLLYSFVRPAVV